MASSTVTEVVTPQAEDGSCHRLQDAQVVAYANQPTEGTSARLEGNNNDLTFFDVNVEAVNLSFENLFEALGGEGLLEPRPENCTYGFELTYLANGAQHSNASADRTFAPHRVDGPEQLCSPDFGAAAPPATLTGQPANGACGGDKLEVTFLDKRPGTPRYGTNEDTERFHVDETSKRKLAELDDKPTKRIKRNDDEALESTADVEAMIDQDLNELERTCAADHPPVVSHLLDVLCGSLPSNVRMAALQSIYEEVARMSPPDVKVFFERLFKERPHFIRCLANLWAESSGRRPVVDTLGLLVENGMEGSQLTKDSKLDLFKLFKVLLKSEDGEIRKTAKSLYVRMAEVKK